MIKNFVILPQNIFVDNQGIVTENCITAPVTIKYRKNIIYVGIESYTWWKNSNCNTAKEEVCTEMKFGAGGQGFN